MSSYLKLDVDLDSYVTFVATGFPGIAATDASFGIWCRFSDLDVDGVLFQKYDGVTGYQARFNKEANGDVSLDFLVASLTPTITTARIDNVPIKLNEWQLFVFVLERGGSLRIYIDAVLHADTINTITPLGDIDNLNDFYIGYNDPDEYLSPEGSIDIDSFFIYVDTFLIQSDIREIYNKGRGVKMLGTENWLEFGLNLDEGTGAVVADVVSGSITGTITSDASPFDLVWAETGGIDVMNPSNIEIYLTSLEPDLEQMNYSQSLGGFISESLLYPKTTLASSLGLYGESITLTDATDLIGYNYVSILNEIVKVETISAANVTVTERGVNNIIGYYPSETIIKGVISPFNDSFNTERKQYRCYAVKNISPTESAYDVSVYFRQTSVNTGTTMRLALESPKSQGITGVSSRWTSSMLIDSSLAGISADNFFTDSYITFEDSPNAGEKRRISSFDGTTGTFVFADSLPVDYDPEIHSSMINYTVDVSPAQRVKSGVEEPVSTDYITSFSEASSRNNSVTLDEVKNEGVLSPGEIFYIWIEREIGKSSISYDENAFVLSIDFNKQFEGD